MRFILSILLLSLSVVAWPASANEFGTKEEAAAMVKRVQAMFKAKGEEVPFVLRHPQHPVSLALQQVALALQRAKV